MPSSKNRGVQQAVIEHLWLSTIHRFDREQKTQCQTPSCRIEQLTYHSSLLQFVQPMPYNRQRAVALQKGNCNSNILWNSQTSEWSNLLKMNLEKETNKAHQSQLHEEYWIRHSVWFKWWATPKYIQDNFCIWEQLYCKYGKSLRKAFYPNCLNKIFVFLEFLYCGLFPHSRSGASSR